MVNRIIFESFIRFTLENKEFGFKWKYWVKVENVNKCNVVKFLGLSCLRRREELKNKTKQKKKQKKTRNGIESYLLRVSSAKTSTFVSSFTLPSSCKWIQPIKISFFFFSISILRKKPYPKLLIFLQASSTSPKTDVRRKYLIPLIHFGNS